MASKFSTALPPLSKVRKDFKEAKTKHKLQPKKKVGKRGMGFKGPNRVSPDQVVKLCKAHLAQMIAVEVKEPQLYESKSAPQKLRGPESGIAYLNSPTSSLFASVLMDMFSQGQYSFDIKTVLNMSSSGTGSVNSVINVSTLSSTSDFLSLASVFNECFVVNMQLAWQPNGRYNGPVGFVPATNVSSLPIGLANLQHGAPAYTSLTNMSNNYRYAMSNTSDPFRYDWINPEHPGSTVLVTPASSGQAWILTSNMSTYGGTVQVLSQPAPPALPLTAVLGVFTVEWRVLFRVRE